MLCTANQCRSPMAEVLLRARFAGLGVDASVVSAGELQGDVAASPGSVTAMAARGLDLRSHRSRCVTPDAIRRADLVLAMGRRHLRHAVSLVPDAFPRTFTFKELARRATSVGPRRGDTSFSQWLASVHDGRLASSLLGDDPRDDVADPIGGPQRLYDAAAEEISDLVDQLVDLAFAGAERRETA